MKNIIIVSKGQNAVAVGDNGMSNIAKTGAGTFLANLEALKAVLATISVEPCETTHIFVSDVIQGIVTGSAVEYVKTGKTGSGKDLTAEEIEGFKEVYKMYAERILNVRFSQHKYIAKDKAELQELKRKAWDALNAVAVTGTTQTVVKTEVVDPDKAIREALDKQMVEAIARGDVNAYKEFKAMRDELQPAQVVEVQGTTTVATGGTRYVETPTFNTDADKAMEGSVEDGGTAVDENGNPLDFGQADNDSKQEPAW